MSLRSAGLRAGVYVDVENIARNGGREIRRERRDAASARTVRTHERDRDSFIGLAKRRHLRRVGIAMPPAGCG